MKKQKLSNLYPTATKGDLKSASATDHDKKEPVPHIRDHSPERIIAMGALVVSALGISMLAITYFLYLTD